MKLSMAGRLWRDGLIAVLRQIKPLYRPARDDAQCRHSAQIE